jgi:hypothetical protein
MGIIDKETFDKWIADLHMTASQYGTFVYTFFKGMAVK